MTFHPLSSDFDSLSMAEKILQLQDAWDRISENPEDVEVTPTQKAALDARLEALANNPEQGKSWGEIKRSFQK